MSDDEITVYDVMVKTRDVKLRFDVWYVGTRKNQRKADKLAVEYLKSIGITADINDIDAQHCHVQKHPMPLNVAKSGVMIFNEPPPQHTYL